MEHRKQPSYTVLLLLWLAGLILWRLLSAMHTNMELYGDEAQYWTWSLHPDWGYYSKPPVVAWLIYLGTHLFGDSELGVRSMSFVLYPLTAWVIFLFVRRLFRAEPEAERWAFWSGLLFATLPMTSLGSWLITTDAPLILSWALAMYFTVAVLETDRWRDWLLLGVVVGLGLLSKYSMVFYGMGFVAYVLASRQRWHLLRSPKPYLAALLAGLFLVPNILWNADHQFVSFHHTAEISELDRSLFHPGALLEFFAGQFLVFGPIAAGWLLAYAIRPRTWFADDRLRMLAAFTLAPIAAFLGLSLLSRAFANWVAFAYASGAALLVPLMLARGRRGWLAAAIAVNLTLGIVAYNYHDIAHLLGTKLTRKTDPYGRVTGFRALGIEVGKRLQEQPGARFLSEDRMLYALFRYYGRPYSEGGRYLNVLGQINNHYALTADVRDSPEGEFLMVSPVMTDDVLKQWFAHVTPQPPIKLDLYPDYKPEYRVWLVSGYLKK